MLSHRQAKLSGPTWPEYFQARLEQVRDPRLRRFYEAGLPDPATPIRDVRFVALDLETTGMEVEKSGIVSIGIVPMGLERIRSSKSAYWVLRPRRLLNEESVVIHHITHSEIANAPDLDEVLGDVLDALAGAIPIVHYYRIERNFLHHAIKLRLDEAFLFPLVDTMVLEARWARQSFRARVRHWLGGEPESLRLHETRERYHLPFYRGHHALTDALATGELFQAQVARRFTPETPIGDLWI